MYANFKEHAIEHVKQAVKEDNAGNYSKAFCLYMNALEYFKTHLKYEKNPKIKEAITQKFVEYLRRAEEVRSILDSGASGPKSNGGAAADAPQKPKSKDGDAKDGEDREQAKLRAGLDSAIIREKPNVKWSDVAGLESAKQALKEAVILPVKFPQFFTDYYINDKAGTLAEAYNYLFTSKSTKVISTNVVHEVLNKYNYENWSGVVKTYLIAHDLWDVIKLEAAQKPQMKDHNTTGDETSESEISVDHKIPKSEAYNLEEDKINARALHAIQISCGPDALSAIQGILSAKVAWRILDERFKPDFFIKFADNSEERVLYTRESFDGLDDKDKDQGEEFKRALKNREWEKVKKMYNKNPSLLKGRFSSKKFSALHYAARDSGRPGIVKDMVDKMSEKDMEIKDACGGGTALMMAIMAGSLNMVKCMMEKNPELISVEDNSKFLPVEVSLSGDDIDVIGHLYYATKAYLSSRDHADRRKHGAMFISKCIKKKKLGTLGFALDLLKEENSLALTKDYTWESPLYVLACSPSLFGDGDELGFFKRWIYKFISTKPATPAAKSGGEQAEDPERGSDTTNMKKSALDSISWRVTKLLNRLLGIEQIREEKLVRDRSVELLGEMCKAVNIKLATAVDRKALKDGLVLEALFAAVERGNTKFVSKLISRVPALWMSTDEYSRDIYMHAIEWRQAKLFTHMLRHISGNLVSATSSMKDKFGNNLLHVAATLWPSPKLDRVPGAALQMQREIQWFKEVEKIVLPAALEEENYLDSLTTREVFTKNHKDLMKEGERWMKETATYCSVVSALIVTMTFATAFTVPDVEENTNKKLREVLIISDGISLFSSTSSMFVFLGILSTRYEERDFLINLPLKLTVGISTLFISIITMLIAFCAIFLFQLPESWVPIPIILLVALTVTLFAAMQFRLLIIVLKSTFCDRLSLNDPKSWNKTTIAKDDD